MDAGHSYTWCVLGNGPIGAAVALELASRDALGCIVGAEFGDRSQLYSAHQDDSRLVRGWHSDRYWSELVQRSVVRLRKLANDHREAPFFADVPMLYRLSSPHSLRPDDRLKPPTIAVEGFERQDILGGILDPLRYVRSMNLRARALGVRVVVGAAIGIDHSTHGFHVRMRDQSIEARYVIDARGVYASAMRDAQATIVGKVVFFVERAAVADTYCFLDECVDAEPFRNAYGCCGYRWSGAEPRSKYGFTERQPVTLRDQADITAWFEGGYLAYPHLREALAWIEAFQRVRAEAVSIKPCVFGQTPDARPVIRWDAGWLTVCGCNGMGAQTCQALAADAARLFDRHAN